MDYNQGASLGDSLRFSIQLLAPMMVRAIHLIATGAKVDVK